MTPQVLLSVLAVEGHLERPRRIGEELAQFRDVIDGVRDGDQRAARHQNARNLTEPGVEIGHVVEHPGRDDRVERAVGERQPLDIAFLRVDASGARQFDHARREVDERHPRPELALHPLRELARTSPDLEHAARMPCLDRAPQNLFCIGAFGVHPQRFARLKVDLGRVLLAHDGRVVECQRSFSATNTV